MAQASSGVLATLHGTPDKCSLKKVKLAIVEILEMKESVTTIKRCKDLKGNVISGKLEVVLKSENDLQKLLQQAVIDYEDNDNLYSLKVTRSRPRTSLNAPSFEKKSLAPSPRAMESSDDTSSSEEDVKKTSKFYMVSFTSKIGNSEKDTIPKLKSRFGKFKGKSAVETSSDDDTTSEEDITSDVRLSKSKQEVQQFSKFRKAAEEKQPLNTSTTKLSKTPIDWFHLLQSDPDLFENYCDRCVMVQDSLDTITSKQLLSSLKLQTNSSPDEIKKIARLHDGILVVFENNKVASKLVKNKYLEINGTKLQVYLKLVPSVFDDRILVKGNFKGNDKEEIEDMLECCTEAEFKVKKLPQIDMFLVSFAENVNVNDIASTMSELPLEEMHPQTIKLCRSDCIKVENVKKGASDDSVKLAFMNKKLNNGDITLVQQAAARNTAFIYFGSYKDAEKVVERSKKMKIKVAKKPVEVSLYCPAIKGSVDFSSYIISQFRYELGVDGDVIRFIQKSRTLQHELCKEMGDLAEVEFEEDSAEESKFSAKLKPLLSEEESQNMEQDNFENDCKSRIRKFCSKFKSRCRKYEDESRDRVRKEQQWDEQDDGIVEVSVKQNDVISVFVRWEPKDGDGIKITGNPKDVSTFLDWFEEKCNFVREVEIFSDEDFQILMDCGIVEEASAYVDENVVVNVDKPNKQVIFEGSKDIVAPALVAIRSSLKRVQDCDMSFLHAMQKRFLQCSLQSKDSKDQIDIVDYLRSKLKVAQIKVCLTLKEDMLRLVYSNQKRTELKQAKEKIRDLIKYDLVSCQSKFDDLMQEDEWKELKAKVESSGTLLIFKNPKTAEIQLVGLPQSFERELKRIKAFFEDNVEIEKRVDLPYPETMFICSFPTEINANEHLNKTEWYEEPGGIHVKGKACHVRKAENWIEEISHVIKTSTKTLSVPGAADFFRGKGGDQFLKITSKDTQCVIQLDSVESEEWNEAANDSMSESLVLKKMEREYVVILDDEEAIQEQASAGWFKSGVKAIGSFLGISESPPTPKQEASVDVSVINGDILQSDCDVVVNTTGNDYNLKKSKLSAKLIAKAGKAMEEECKFKPIYGKKDIYRVTTAPNLPFRNVIHLVSPNSADEISTHLSEVFFLVEDNLKLSSVAIPAIGTGQIGLSSLEVAKSIRKATDAFKKTDPVHLQRIDVVVFEKRMVFDFKKALLGPSPPSKSKKSKSITSAVDPQTPRSQPAGPVQVTVTRGDILASTCEVMINTTGSDFNVTASQLSQMLVQKAGPGIGTEKPLHQADIYRVTSGGKTNFHNIVHFVTPSTVESISSGLERVLTLVDATLKKSSLAIPAIGTGNAKLGIPNVAKAMQTAIDKFLSKKPKFLYRIDVVIFDQKMLSVFQNHISPKVQSVPTVSASPPKKNETSNEDDNKGSSSNKTPESKKSRSGYFPKTDESDTRHSVVLFFTSNNKSSMTKAWKAVRDKAEDKCAKKVIENDILESLDKDDWDDIMALEREFNVTIRPPDEDDPVTNKFFILGLKNKVIDAYTYALTLLQKFHKAVTCQEFINWKYEDEQTKSWENFSLLTNLEIEDSYKENNTGNKQFYSKMKGSKASLTFDFTKMTAIINDDPKSECKINRVAISGVSNFPSTWNNTKHVQLVALDPTKTEYSTVLNKFNSTRGNVVFNVVRIERVENRRLYAQFMAQKNEVEDRMRNSNKTLPVTRELFHGTHHNVAEQIYKGGFNRSYAGRNATVYGNGVYFALSSQYSNRFAAPNNQGEKKMFLADVVTGEYGQGQQGMIAPPQRPNGTTADLYDSVVDNLASPAMYVVFKDASVYPLYLLTYR